MTIEVAASALHDTTCKAADCARKEVTKIRVGALRADASRPVNRAPRRPVETGSCMEANLAKLPAMSNIVCWFAQSPCGCVMSSAPPCRLSLALPSFSRNVGLSLWEMVLPSKARAVWPGQGTTVAARRAAHRLDAVFDPLCCHGDTEPHHRREYEHQHDGEPVDVLDALRRGREQRETEDVGLRNLLLHLHATQRLSPRRACCFAALRLLLRACPPEFEPHDVSRVGESVRR